MKFQTLISLRSPTLTILRSFGQLQGKLVVLYLSQVRMGGGLLKAYLVMEADEFLKASHVSTMVAFIWAIVNLRVICFLIQFIRASQNKYLSFRFGPLSLS